MATATISSALSSVVGTSRRFADSAAIDPAIMPTIHPTTASLIKRLNIVSPSSTSLLERRFCAFRRFGASPP
jgi:hypothetical protein